MLSCVLQFRLPISEFEQFQSAESDYAQRAILERFAQDLPITTRTLTGGKYLVTEMGQDGKIMYLDTCYLILSFEYQCYH